ncbi:zinc finger protein 182-like [Anopheles moucheti]|uniref:zinc finger protein 182-like n=1 Tax=Anopheles moucheti TaxID=186751 RepID=UPI0022F09CC0|nr:zinc finger protein 182-like [Anopheles moucheti]
MQAQSQASTETWIISPPVRYEEDAKQFSTTIKVEQRDTSETIPHMNCTQSNKTIAEDTTFPTNAHTRDDTGEYSFVDEIEIGETTIVSSLGEHVEVKMEYISSDESSVEQKIHDGNKTSSREAQNKPHTAVTNMENKKLPYKCEFCESSFFNTRQLSNHRRNHQLEECPVCRKTIIFRYLKEHIALNHPKADILSDKRLYKCDQCEKIFHCKTLLIDHQRNHQTKECPICKQMIKLRVLNMHMARKHSAHVPLSERHAFQCDQCDKSFVSKPQLVDHQRDHMVKNCPECGTKIMARCLKKHMARKHPPGGGNDNMVRLYKCEWCEKSYANKSSLLFHQANHEQMLCNPIFLSPDCDKLRRNN